MRTKGFQLFLFFEGKTGLAFGGVAAHGRFSF